jgi:phage terminase large subunit-like protein
VVPQWRAGTPADDRNKLRDFEKAGELTIVDDELQDISKSWRSSRRSTKMGLLACVALDPAGIGEFVDALAGIGITQENKASRGRAARLRHDERDQDGRAQIGERHADPFRQRLHGLGGRQFEDRADGNRIRATKQHAGDAKIDPAMSLFDAVYVMQTNPDAGRSVYEDRDLLVL